VGAQTHVKKDLALVAYGADKTGVLHISEVAVRHPAPVTRAIHQTGGQ
jgi:predicted RNA-binding protein with RPS1 domain